MAPRPWLPRALFGIVAVLMLSLCLANDPAKLSREQFFSDGATYYSMTWSLVKDFDLEYTARDLVRVRREYPNGPSGIFLKRASGGFELVGAPPWVQRVPESRKKIYFGKAMTYAVLAAPFVAALGSRGFLVFNCLCLLGAWACAFWEIRRRASEAVAMVGSGVLILATIAPLYVFWIQPEVMNLSLVCLALLAWSRDRPMISALLFGLAGYTKPTHLLMAAPLGLSPLLVAGVTPSKRVLEVLRRGAVMVGFTCCLFGVNALVTGEWNYQGGERKTFGFEFPFDRGAARDVTFGNSGEWMTTMKLGPLEEGEEESRGSGIAQSPVELDEMFMANLSDFWLGRYAGMLPYFAPAFVALLFFLVMGPRDGAGWLAVTSLMIFYLVSIRVLPGPSNWYGGGGTVGNRYFMAALPLAIYFLPKGRELQVALLGALLGATFLLPAWLSPVQHSLRPSLLASTPGGPLTYLRAERAMLNDLSFCTDAWRKKQAYDDVEGDPPLHRSGSQRGYWLYFPDDGTFGREAIPGMTFPNGDPMEGYRVRRGAATEVLLRANEPVDWIDVMLIGSGYEDDVEIEAGGEVARKGVRAQGSVAFRLVPGPSVMYYDSFVYSVKTRSLGAPLPGRVDNRAGHTLVRLSLHVSPRPRR